MVPVLIWRVLGMAEMEFLPIDDFVEYWSASQLLLAGKNPYSASELMALQKSIGYTKDVPVIMYNPPWTLAFVLPMGLFSYAISRLLWILISLGLIFLVSHWMWDYYHGPKQNRWVGLAISISFFPTIHTLREGQISPLILLGILGFLWFESRKKSWLAGVSTIFIAIKPHLLLIYWFSLLYWTIRRKDLGFVLGGLLGTAVCIGIPLLFDHNLINNYLAVLAQNPPTQFIPMTLGGLIRSQLGYSSKWPLYIPVITGTLWLIIHLRRNENYWEWGRQLPLLLTVSVTCATFGWMHDLIVLIPVLMYWGACSFLHKATPMLVLSSILYLFINTSLE